MKTQLTKQLLTEEYLDERKSPRAIASRYGWSQPHVRRALIKHEIPLRSYSEAGRDAAKAARWTGCGEITGCYWSSIRFSARLRKIPLRITITYAWKLFLKQNRKCALSGLDIAFSKNTEEHRIGVGTASLDRIDSTKPYEHGNVQWVHKIVNIMKREYPQETFVAMCCHVARNMTQKVVQH